MRTQEPEGPPAAHMRLPPFDGGKSFRYTNSGECRWKVSSPDPGISLANSKGRESTGTLVN